MKNSLRANTPMRTESKGIPLISLYVPNVNRSMPMSLSTPMVEMRRPSIPEMIPLIGSLPVLAMMVRPKNDSAK